MYMYAYVRVYGKLVKKKSSGYHKIASLHFSSNLSWTPVMFTQEKLAAVGFLMQENTLYSFWDTGTGMLHYTTEDDLAMSTPQLVKHEIVK